MSDNDTPAWAYNVAYERSHGKHRFTEDYLKQSYTESHSVEAAVMRAFAAQIATKEPELKPVTSFDVLESAIRDVIYNDRQSDYWHGSVNYAHRIMNRLDDAGFHVVKKESAQ